MRAARLYALLALTATWSVVVLADVWDPTDGGFSTANELVHGSVQVHELGHSGLDTRDVDFFRIGERLRSSYEVVVDAPTNAIAGAAGDVVLERYTGVVLTQVADAYHEGVGESRSLRWENVLGSSVNTTFIRVTSTAPCSGLCSSSIAGYHIRAYETTYSIPRFNNAGSQITVLQIHNMSGRPVAGNVHFWSGGALLGSHPFSLSGQQLLVLNTSTLPFAAGAAGSITVSHDGHYGQLAGKAVALEPSTGFTFDTMMVPRPL